MTRPTPTGSPTDVKLYPRLYWVLFCLGIGILIAILAAGTRMWNLLLWEVFGLPFKGGPMSVLLAGLYTALSLRIVQANETAGAFCYGRALKHLSSGLHFIPYKLMQLVTESQTVQEVQFPADPELVYKGDDKDPLPAGMFRPIRVVTRAPEKEDASKGVLHTQMTFVVSFAVQYVVEDVVFYVSNFGDQEIVHTQMRDVGEATIAEDATTKTTAEFIEGLPLLNKQLKERLQDRFVDSGISIISARLIAPDVTHKVGEALAGIPLARAKAEQEIIAAEATKVALTKKGEGNAAAEAARLAAQAAGRKKMRDDLGVSGDSVLASEAVREVLKETDTIIVGGESGMRDMMGLLKGAQSAFRSGGEGDRHEPE